MRVQVVWLAVMMISCDGSPSPDRVTLYVSADEHVARQVIERFEDATGIEVQVVGDTELKKTTGLVERIRREAERPRADVFWNSEAFMTEALAAEGLLTPHTSEVASSAAQASEAASTFVAKEIANRRKTAAAAASHYAASSATQAAEVANVAAQASGSTSKAVEP